MALTIVAAIILTFYLMVHRVQGLHDDTCAGLTAIAADQDKVNPGSVILSGEMMLRHLGWPEAADLVVPTDELAIDECLGMLLTYVEGRFQA